MKNYQAPNVEVYRFFMNDSVANLSSPGEDVINIGGEGQDGGEL